MNPIEKLCSISSDAIVSEYTPIGLVEKHYALSTILKKKNGFFAFEGALHFYPTAGDEISIESINGEREWIVEYDGLADGLFFFAQDIFGSQYCIRESDGMFCKFEVETGHVEDKSTHLSGLIELILKDFDFESGHTFAKEWQEKNKSAFNDFHNSRIIIFSSISDN